MLEPTEGYNIFESEEEKLLKFISWGLASAKAKKIKENFIYKGIYKEQDTPCIVVGYIKDYEIVIEFQDKVKHKIHPAYLKQMQGKGFNRNETQQVED